MTKIVTRADCGNSPKNRFLEALTIAFAKGDVKTILASVSDDVSWAQIGRPVVHGKDAFLTALLGAYSRPARQLTISHVLSHGKTGAVDGTCVWAHGERLAFCDVFEFASAKGDRVKSITTYVLPDSGIM